MVTAERSSSSLSQAAGLSPSRSDQAEAIANVARTPMVLTSGPQQEMEHLDRLHPFLSNFSRFCFEAVLRERKLTSSYTYAILAIRQFQ